MVLTDNCATSKGPVDKVRERLLWPVRFREDIGVARYLEKR